MREVAGATSEFSYGVNQQLVLRNGRAEPSDIPRTLVRAVLQSRGRVLPVLFNALIRVNTRPDLGEGELLDSWQRSGGATRCRRTSGWWRMTTRVPPALIQFGKSIRG